MGDVVLIVDDLGVSLLQHLHGRERLQLGDHHGRDVGDDIHLAAQQLQHARGVLGDHLEFQVLHRGLPAPIRIVASQHDLLARLPALQLERPGAGGIAAVVLAEFLQRGRAQDRQVEHRELRDHRRERLLCGDRDGVLVDHLRFLDEARDRAARRSGGRIEDAVERRLHGLGVELRAVVELHALAQLERPGELVGRHAPRLGEFGHELPLLVEAHEVLVDVHGDTHVRALEDEMRIERGRVVARGEDERAGRRRRLRGVASGEQRESERERSG